MSNNPAKDIADKISGIRMDEIKKFWDNQAKEHGTSDLATAPDHYYREYEIGCILPLLNDGDSILDIGCGNGYATLKFAEACPSSSIIGVDYSEAMIDQARHARDNQHGAPDFVVGNVLTLTDNTQLRPHYDTIICTRVLINLDSWDKQKAAILQMKALLKPGGLLLLVENTKEGLANLNRLRTQFGLDPIKERWHNNYLPQEPLEEFLEQHFCIELNENIGNLYYIISRVLYAVVCQSNGTEPQYDHLINKIAAQLPSLGFEGDYSPNMMYILRNTD